MSKDSDPGAAAIRRDAEAPVWHIPTGYCAASCIGASHADAMHLCRLHGTLLVLYMHADQCQMRRQYINSTQAAGTRPRKAQFDTWSSAVSSDHRLPRCQVVAQSSSSRRQRCDGICAVGRQAGPGGRASKSRSRRIQPDDCEAVRFAWHNGRALSARAPGRRPTQTATSC